LLAILLAAESADLRGHTAIFLFARRFSGLISAMPRFVPISDYHEVDVQGQPRRALPKEAFDKFNPDVLGLGDISARSIATDAIAAVFDLQGFTEFCKIEPQLSVPKYLDSFLAWLMEMCGCAVPRFG
jgi:hypothetical protein